jgi:beta-galactosidase
VGLIGAASLILPAPAAAAPFVWLEGEKPTRINYQPNPEGVGNPHFLSGTNWLKISLEADKLEKEAPAEGVLVDYAFEAPAAGEYEIWARLGYEFVRSAFAWRLDGAEWHPVSPEELTTDLMELSYWTEVAWLKLGKKPLSPGPHTLAIQLPKTKDAKGKPQRILFALDCLCLSAGEFHPYSHFKPGEDHQTGQDRQAARQVFQMPDPKTDGERVALPLNGLWEICRHDEQTPGEVAAPIRDFPSAPRWTAIAVPGDKNSRQDLVFAHRLWYRTRVNVPASLAGRSFFLVFPQNNLNTTVFVNRPEPSRDREGASPTPARQFCGFDKNPFARVQIDLGRSLRPGLNEIWIGIRDAWYGYSSSPTNPLKLRKRWNLPKQYLGNGFQDLAYPVWNHPQSGILVTPELVAAGGVYAADVFCRPSVANQALTVDITVKNPGPQDAAGEIVCEAVNAKTGAVEKRFAARPFSVAAGGEKLVSLTEPWANPKLWWPDEPNLYRLRARVAAARVTDISDTTFGFREWGSRGKDFTLNGLP